MIRRLKSKDGKMTSVALIYNRKGRRLKNGFSSCD
jgi:hypothetical protein